MLHAGSHVQTSRPCQIGTDFVPDATKGVVVALTNTLDTPIFVVRFDDGKLLPMRESEIEALDEAAP